MRKSKSARSLSSDKTFQNVSINQNGSYGINGDGVLDFTEVHIIVLLNFTFLVRSDLERSIQFLFGESCNEINRLMPSMPAPIKTWSDVIIGGFK